MPAPPFIELADGTRIPILYEDRSVLAIDKPPGWMLATSGWIKTARNLQLALQSSVRAGDYWARARQLQFIRFVHRLDADTTGVLLLVKSRGALHPFSRLFAGREIRKVYLAVVRGTPPRLSWTCKLAIQRHRRFPGRMRVIRLPEDQEGLSESESDAPRQPPEGGPKIRPAETHFRLLATREGRSLVEARPVTGRTHQIRVHLAGEGWPVLGDTLYGRNPSIPRSRQIHSKADMPEAYPLALRAVALGYRDPFTRRPVWIEAPWEPFVRAFGFEDFRDYSPRAGIDAVPGSADNSAS